MSDALQFLVETDSSEAGGQQLMRLAVEARQLVIAGWTGRDAASIEHHIEELEALGVPRPSSVPLYYRAGAGLLSQAPRIEVLGPHSSGEAEPCLFLADGEWWLTVASDHTDREVETYSVAVSKQMCPKPIAGVAWRWDDVAARQDELELRSRIFEGGEWVPYQRGSLAAIRPLSSLRDGLPGGVRGEGSFITCGTLPALPNATGEAIRPAVEMEIELHDPRRRRSIVHRYGVDVLTIVS